MKSKSTTIIKGKNMCFYTYSQNTISYYFVEPPSSQGTLDLYSEQQDVQFGICLNTIEIVLSFNYGPNSN